MRSIRASQNLLAISANTAETALNTFQSADTALGVDEASIINLEPRRETNVDELNGREEADLIYDNGATAGLPLSFKKAQPQHYAMLLAYGLGECSTVAQGTGYLHTITPIAGDVDLDRSLKGFTAVQRLGDAIVKRRFASMFVDTVNANFARDGWCEISGQAKGTGKYEKNVVSESITEAANATSLTLAANGVQGSTAQERLDSIHQIVVELAAGVKTEVAFSAVSSATPAVITITAPDVGTGNVTYTVLYVPTEAAWCTFPARVTESPLKVCALEMVIGGAWNGSAFVGGRTVTSEIVSVEYSLANNLEISFVPGGCDSHANRCFRPGRTQMLKLNRELRDYILQNYVDNNEYFGVKLELIGAEFATGENYRVTVIFPRLGVLATPVSIDNKRLAEAGDLQVLSDDTYGSIIVEVLNQVSGYAA